ncbi:MAG: hypothetical protein LBU67_02555 [Oscillospiraceae bacterium]|jgi:hypothetical protein|nr:hypothetical protein [Oscillospiraceae bacterium]
MKKRCLALLVVLLRAAIFAAYAAEEDAADADGDGFFGDTGESLLALQTTTGYEPSAAVDCGDGHAGGG